MESLQALRLELEELTSHAQSIKVAKRDLFYPAISQSLIHAGFTLVGVLDLLPKTGIESLMQKYIDPQESATLWPVFLIELKHKKEIHPEEKVRELVQELNAHGKRIQIITNYDIQYSMIAITVDTINAVGGLQNYVLCKGVGPCSTSIAQSACCYYSKDESSYKRLLTRFYYISENNFKRIYLANLFSIIHSCESVKQCYIFSDITSKQIIEIASIDTKKWKITEEYINLQRQMTHTKQKIHQIKQVLKDFIQHNPESVQEDLTEPAPPI